MGEAAAFVTDVFAPEFIDINFGCPVKKVVRRNGGSGCLKDLEPRAGSHSRRRRGARAARDVQDPQRLERGDARSCHDRAALPGRRRSRARAASAHAHADVLGPCALGRDRRRRRTRSTSRCLATATSRRRTTRIRMWRETNCAGVMIARGSFGQPWIFDQTRDLLEGRPMRAEPAVEERFAIALDHARMANDYEPDRKGAAIEFRKHLGWYVKGLPGSAELRKKLHAVTSLGEVEGIFEEYLQIARSYIADRTTTATAESLETPRHEARARSRSARAGRGRIARRRAGARRVWRSSRSNRSAFATIDHHRALRQGFPEVIYGAGKTPEQICEIAARIAARGDGVLVTRLALTLPSVLARERCPASRSNAAARTAHLRGPEPPAHGPAPSPSSQRERATCPWPRKRGDLERARELRGASHGRRRRWHPSCARASAKSSTRPPW